MGRGSSALEGGVSGAGTGALVGSAFGAPWAGAAVGGGLGLLTGWLGGGAADEQREATEKAMKRLQEIQREQYTRRMADLQRTMAFYEAPKGLLATQFGQQPIRALPPPQFRDLSTPPRTPPTPMGATPLDILNRGY